MKFAAAALAVLLLAAIASGDGGSPAVDITKPGMYTSGKWTYTLEVRKGGYQTENRTGTLTYDGKRLDLDPEINDHVRTPWGTMYWVGKRRITWGSNGWMPQRHPKERRSGKELQVPGLPPDEYDQLKSNETAAPVPSTATPASIPPAAPPQPLPPAAPAQPMVPGTDIVLGREATGHYIEAVVGQTITVRLAGNPTTGFGWAALPPDDPAVAAVGNSEYQQNPADAGRVGAGGTYIFRFRAERPGAAKLVIQYRRPWEPGPTEVFHVLVRVARPAQP
ncbi:MAG TPA: protease inhibitor I42 family protein [Acidobacteriota bacterium]|nr:protease inhibitor I42 family protein [Acidobacteriota bacterium]HQF88530.1 protease inhibitor I42 family protein [Acidobacteriota bacterium]HQG92798.1 protease inhibitor I42 family protein [Acidobacteriota bacterium]